MTFPKPTTDALTNLQTTFNYGQNYKRINQSNMEKFNRLNTPQFAAYMVPKGATVLPFTIDVTGSYDTNYSVYTSGDYAGNGGTLLFDTVGQSTIAINNLPSGTSINVLCLGGGGGGGGGGSGSSGNSCGVGGGGGGLYLSTITVSGTYNITVGNGGLGGTGNSGGIGGNGDNGGSSKVIGTNYNVTAEGGGGGGGGNNIGGGVGGNLNYYGKIYDHAGGDGGYLSVGVSAGNGSSPYNQLYNSSYQLRCGGGGGGGSPNTVEYYAGNWNNYTPTGNNNLGAGGSFNARGGIGNSFSISPSYSEPGPYSIYAGGGGGGSSYGGFNGGNGAQGFVLVYW